MRCDDAAIQFGTEIRQLHPVVDACDEHMVVDVLGVHRFPVGPDDGDGIGQIKLMLGVVG